MRSRQVRGPAPHQSRAEQHSPLEGAQVLPTGREDPIERQREGSASADSSPPPTNQASSCLARQSNKKQPDAPRTLRQVPIPASGQKKSLSVASRQRSNDFRRDREREPCFPPHSPVRVADSQCTTGPCDFPVNGCLVTHGLLRISLSAVLGNPSRAHNRSAKNVRTHENECACTRTRVAMVG
jgi:hypothetical protein